MSVEKVNKYKAEKNAKNKEMKKEKLEQLIANIIIAVAAVALVVWIGFSVYQKISAGSEADAGTTVNLNALDDYVNSLEVVQPELD